MKSFSSIDEYVADFPRDIQDKLNLIRKTIGEIAPEATEKINYGIPTFYLNGNLVHFAAFKNHIGFYPAPSGIEAFEKELTKYRTGKGTLQFPLDQELPIELIKKVAKFRVKENLKKKKPNY